MSRGEDYAGAAVSEFARERKKEREREREMLVYPMCKDLTLEAWTQKGEREMEVDLTTIFILATTHILI